MKKKRRIILSVFLLLLGGVAFSAFNKQDRNFQISKHFDILHALYRELDIFYVDSMDVQEVFTNSIQGMLSSYDPYTEYIPEEELSDFKYITTREYGGIGSVISRRDDKIIIVDPYENMPAQKGGLLCGDELLEINGQEVSGKDVDYASNLLRGEPNTTVSLLIRREGEKKLIKKELVRQLIQLSSVEYAGLVGPNVGYICLSGFSENSYTEVRQALADLKKAGAESLVLDLRGNGGGLLTAAVSICNLFVEKGEKIVSTKGKVPKWDRIYKTMREPMDKEIPLVVLTNSMSASSSEIVAGALQDLDRAVIMGTRTFGKGLVQTTRELPYNGMVKITSAKYYIPSGRCIQAIDYSNRNADGSVGRIPDSLASDFRTRNGRLVQDGGGIKPDVDYREDAFAGISYRLVNDMLIFDYANHYHRNHPKIAPVSDFTLSDKEYQDFCAFVLSKGQFKYELRSEKYLNGLKKSLEEEGYWAEIESEYKALEEKMKRDTAKDLALFAPEIKRLLSAEIVHRYYYQRGEMQESLKSDRLVKKAIDLLSNPEQYRSILQNPAQ